MPREKSQQKLLREARATLKVSNEGLAELLFCSTRAVESWIAPAGSTSARNMPKQARALLEQRLKDRRK